MNQWGSALFESKQIGELQDGLLQDNMYNYDTACTRRWLRLKSKIMPLT